MCGSEGKPEVFAVLRFYSELLEFEIRSKVSSTNKKSIRERGEGEQEEGRGEGRGGRGREGRGEVRRGRGESGEGRAERGERRG